MSEAMDSKGMDYERRFGGMARLYGPQALARLQAGHVCVIGIGGVGSWAVEALARSGIGKLTLVDLDHVAESNMNRQLHAVEENLGKAKVQAMAERIASINPDCQVVQVDDFITPDNIASLIPACDAVIDAIDQVRAKVALAAHCRRHKQWLVTTGGAGGRTDPTRVKVEDLSRTTQDALASKVRASLRKDFGFPRDPKKKFNLPCVYSDEQIIRPQAGAACETDGQAPRGLNCAGYGSLVTVTAAFGFAAASQALTHVLKH
ncbi:MAG TPA: tRNA cyclic N6-threonylcarbamoyladenosine(37) synthase TcdA [Rhodocyclaceae bacterium]